jgi:hypothetical protein
MVSLYVRSRAPRRWSPAQLRSLGTRSHAPLSGASAAPPANTQEWQWQAPFKLGPTISVPYKHQICTVQLQSIHAGLQ